LDILRAIGLFCYWFVGRADDGFEAFRPRISHLGEGTRRIHVFTEAAMRNLSWVCTLLLTSLAVLLAGTLPAAAQPYYALQYWGGPVLEQFTIYPLYYGDWSHADIDAQQAYLKSLAAYVSGEKAPAGQQPAIRQYGVMGAAVAAAVTASPTAKPNSAITRAELLNIIEANQKSGKLPPYGKTTLIALFLAHGFELQGCDRCSYHASNSNTEYWMVVPHDTGAPYELSTAHEVFESATDPVVDNSSSWGWLTGGYYPQGSSSLVNDEMVDECGDKTITLKNLGIQIPAVTDNTSGVSLGNPADNVPAGGGCSTTGYTSLSEIQVYGWSFADYKKEYDSLWPDGWRLYILQSYVMPNGHVAMNAVWRPSGDTAEIQQYGATYGQYRAEYDELWPLGWRIYILDSYVQNGVEYFNAVWRPGDVGETQLYEVTPAQFNTQRNTLYSQDWRLRMLDAIVPAGDVEYNAVLRHGVTSDTTLFGVSFSDYKSRYNSLWLQGWRLYLLQSYLQGDGAEVFDAVFHPGNHGEIQIYGATYSEYRSEYDSLWPDGWRLYILQSFVAADGITYYNAVWRQATIDRPL
jgi:Bacterial tandem repeat domain 1